MIELPSSNYAGASILRVTGRTTPEARPNPK